MTSLSQEQSSSLQIAEPEVQLEVNNSNSREAQQTQEQPEEGLFDLSRDEPTLSFAIEPQPLPQPAPPPAVVPQNQRKRKEIFEKFKRPGSKRTDGTEGGEERLLNIFDSIFNVKCEVEEQRKKKEEEILELRSSSARSRTPSTERKQRMKIFAGRDRSDSKKMLPSNILQENYSMHSVIAQERRQDQPESDKSSSRQHMSLSAIERRLSGIHGAEKFQESRDSLEIHQILDAEIFRENGGKVQSPIKKQRKSLSPIEQQKRSPSPPYKGQKSPSPLKNISKLTSEYTDTGNQFKASLSQVSTGSVLTLQNYRQGQPFDPKSSMANIPDTPIQDLIGEQFASPKQQPVFAKKKKSSKTDLYESQVTEYQAVPVLCAQPVMAVEERMPVFLRSVRRQIGSYPNLWWQGQHSKAGAIRQELMELLGLVGKAVGVLSHFCQRVLQTKSKTNLYMNELMNSLTLADFTQLGWQKVVNVTEYQPIRPLEGFEKRSWDFQRAKKALVNYQSIVDYYLNKKFTIDVMSEQGRTKYFEIRRKFWDICGNLKLISEDIYNEMLTCLFPWHYYRILEYLDSPDHSLTQVKNLLNLIRHLQLQRDPLAASEIGRKTQSLLLHELRLMRPL